MLQIRSGSDQTWDVEYSPGGAISVDNQPFVWNLTAVGDGRYHLLYKDRSYSVEVISADYAMKAFVLRINGSLIELQAKDRFDLLLDKLGMSNVAAHKVNELKAPMPGLIVAIRVVPGQTVRKGDPLLVLEAMKMENILKAPGDGVVGTIKVGLRDNVTKGQALVLFS